uniref:PIN domain-containing protein n=1 Tax=uncultured bacterium contig00259 TaxID=1181615 RepID=A0A806KHB0_9BACT|nr:hypothetical protein [uncultured bacterium contig00259]
MSPEEISHYSETLDTHCYDPIDFVIASHYKAYGIITDDQDFAHDASISTYTLIKNTNKSASASLV